MNVATLSLLLTLSTGSLPVVPTPAGPEPATPALLQAAPCLVTTNGADMTPQPIKWFPATLDGPVGYRRPVLELVRFDLASGSARLLSVKSWSACKPTAKRG